MRLVQLRPPGWTPKKHWKIFSIPLVETVPHRVTAEIAIQQPPKRPGKQKEPPKSTFNPLQISIYNQGASPELFDLARAKLALSLLSENTNLCQNRWTVDNLWIITRPLWTTSLNPKLTLFFAFPIAEGPAGGVHESRDLSGLVSSVLQGEDCRGALVIKQKYQQRQIQGFILAVGQKTFLSVELICSSKTGNEIGRSLMQSAEAWAIQQGYRVLKLKAVPEAVGFYQSLGFQIGSKSLGLVNLTKQLR